MFPIGDRSRGRHTPLNGEEIMVDRNQLTKRQEAVYDFIRDKIHQRGYGPTVREIGNHFDISSPNGVMCHLKALEKKGLIIREPNRSRAITLVTESATTRGLPLVGRIAAGVQLEAIEQNERFDFNELFKSTSQELFVLEVDGDSMIEDQIADGDYVVIRKQDNAHRGEIVVALTDENEATLKRWFPEDGRIRLQPSNSAMEPIYVDNARVLGIMVGVVRKLD